MTTTTTELHGVPARFTPLSTLRIRVRRLRALARAHRVELQRDARTLAGVACVCIGLHGVWAPLPWLFVGAALVIDSLTHEDRDAD